MRRARRAALELLFELFLQPNVSLILVQEPLLQRAQVLALGPGGRSRAAGGGLGGGLSAALRGALALTVAVALLPAGRAVGTVAARALQTLAGALAQAAAAGLGIAGGCVLS